MHAAVCLRHALPLTNDTKCKHILATLSFKVPAVFSVQQDSQNLPPGIKNQQPRRSLLF
jgi:hypothetical protein